MATKAQIKQKIQESLTLNLLKTTRSKHEEYLHTNAFSLLESVYATKIVENNLSQTIFQALNANIDFEVRVYKQGRTVFVDGYIRPINSTNLSGIALSIINSEYQPDYFQDIDGALIGDVFSTSTYFPLYIAPLYNGQSNVIYLPVNQVIYNGERVRFNFNYYAKN